MKKIFKRGSIFILSLILSVFLAAGFVSTTVMAAGDPPRSITLNRKKVTMEVGEKVTLKVKSVKPKTAARKVTWESSDKSVATVGSRGVVKARKEGTAVITARAVQGKAFARCRITVKKAPEGKTLVAYFSATGTTQGVAKKIAAATGGDLVQIVPEIPYTDEDLNYNNDDCRANREQEDESARPAIRGSIQDMAAYDTIYLGFPIWWGSAPRIMDTFVEGYDFTGKTVIPFCTSGSSGIGRASDDLKKLCKGNPAWKEGRRFAGGVSQSTVNAWVESLGLK